MRKHKCILYSLLSVMLLSLFSCGSDRRKDNPGDIYIGETCGAALYRDEKKIAEFTITNDGFSYETIDDDVLIKSKVTFDPKQPFTMYENDYFARVSNITYYGETTEGKVLTSKEYNVKENGYDIFDKEISSKTTYTFCFLTPLINNGVEFKKECTTICYLFKGWNLYNKYWEDVQ